MLLRNVNPAGKCLFEGKLFEESMKSDADIKCRKYASSEVDSSDSARVGFGIKAAGSYSVTTRQLLPSESSSCIHQQLSNSKMEVLRASLLLCFCLMMASLSSIVDAGEGMMGGLFGGGHHGGGHGAIETLLAAGILAKLLRHGGHGGYGHGRSAASAPLAMPAHGYALPEGYALH